MGLRDKKTYTHTHAFWRPEHREWLHFLWEWSRSVITCYYGSYSTFATNKPKHTIEHIHHPSFVGFAPANKQTNICFSLFSLFSGSLSPSMHGCMCDYVLECERMCMLVWYIRHSSKLFTHHERCASDSTIFGFWNWSHTYCSCTSNSSMIFR